MVKKNLLILSIITIMGVSACSIGASEATISSSGEVIGQVVPVDGGGQYIDITPQELNRMLEEKDFFFVNVHIPYEGELPDTDAFIPYDEIDSHLSEFPQDKDARIVLYCRRGSMSTIAAREMVQLGYINIYNLDGGFRAWSEAGYKLIP
jgi:rhodanese-related sulfurtransferase